MPIELRDIHDAVKAYMDTKITVTIKVDTKPIDLNPADGIPVGDFIDIGEGFQFTLTAQNAPKADCVALKNIFWYVTVDPTPTTPAGIGKLIVPPSPMTARVDTYESKPATDPGWFAAGTLQNAMYVFPEVFDSSSRKMYASTTTTLSLTGKATGPGTINIRAKLIGTVDMDWLFAQGEFYTGFPDHKDTPLTIINAASKLTVRPQ